MSFKKDDNSSMFISFLYISLLDKTKCKRFTCVKQNTFKLNNMTNEHGIRKKETVQIQKIFQVIYQNC